MNDPGLRAEDRVQKYFEASFFSDFTFRRPMFVKGGIEKEAADVLIWFDDVLVVAQSKARNLAPESLLLPGRETKWAEKNLRAALRQCRGGRRALLEGRVPTLENPRRGRIPFIPEDVKETHGIIVLDQEILPYDPLALVPELNNAGFPIHVISAAEWPLLCKELSTTPDFIAYLRFRWHNHSLQPYVFGQEADLLATFIIKERADNASLLGFRPIEGLGTWFGENMKSEIAERDRLDRPSFLIDNIIDHLHDIDDGVTPFEGLRIETSREAYMLAATELSKMKRVERRLTGAKLLKKMELAGEGNCDRYFASSGPQNTAYFFLASPLRRQERMGSLAAGAAVAKHALGVRKMVGIATESGIGPGRSYDTVYLDYECRPDKQADTFAAEMFAPAAMSHETEFKGRVQGP